MKKFDNYCRALTPLEQAPQQDLDNELIRVRDGISQRYSLLVKKEARPA